MEGVIRGTLPATGDVLLGKYRLVRIVGEGGMGVVYEALHERLDQRVAIKVLRPEVATVPEVVTRFAREARAAGKLGSRHTARTLDIENHNGLPVMVMEFLVGNDLAEELEARGPLPIEEAVGYVLATCAAMSEAHALGIVHRDLKPSNLFLSEDRGERVVKVLDFGISKMSEANDVHLTATSGTMGTPLYMSPEQVRSAKKVDHRTDIWSLGVILYELLTGQLPFPGEHGPAVIAAIVADEPVPIRSLRAEVPEELAATIHDAMAKRPDARYPDIAAFAARLAPFGPAAPSDRFRLIQPSAPVLSDPPSSRGSDPGSDPAFFMAATQRGTPPVTATAGAWSTENGRRGRSRTLLIGVVLGIMALVGAIVFFATSASRRPAPAAPPSAMAAAPSSADVASSIAPLAPIASEAPSAAPPPLAESASAPSVASTRAPRPVIKPPAIGTTKSPPVVKPPPPSEPASNPNRL